jgi:hypothetical protein
MGGTRRSGPQSSSNTGTLHNRMYSCTHVGCRLLEGHKFHVIYFDAMCGDLEPVWAHVSRSGLHVNITVFV